ncbi:hypothetical protein Sjap_013171 [Stephania japonica]|uniref:Uncharacterized protein n=1 Tax=Stephania japonica TaxID=461633 RepID=A0AAP0IXI2_9MAGN
MEKDWLTLFGHREMRTYHVGIVRCKCDVHLKVHSLGSFWLTLSDVKGLWSKISIGHMKLVKLGILKSGPFNVIEGVFLRIVLGLVFEQWYCKGVQLWITQEVINGRTLVVDIKKCEELSASPDVSPMEKDWLTLFGHREMRTYHVGIVRCKCDVHLKEEINSYKEKRSLEFCSLRCLRGRNFQIILIYDIGYMISLVSFSSNGTAKGYNFGLLSWSHDFGVKGIFDKMRRQTQTCDNWLTDVCIA